MECEIWWNIRAVRREMGVAGLLLGAYTTGTVEMVVLTGKKRAFDL